MGEEAKFNILMFPWLGHGHVSPFLELARKLINSKPSIIIHFCSTSVILDTIKSSLSKHESDSIKLVEFVLVSSKLPPEQHAPKNVPTSLIPTLMEDCRDSISSFIDIMDSLKPDLLIYDLFSPWAVKYALSRGIPRVNFVICGAAATAFLHHQYTHGANFPYQEIFLRDEENIDYMGLATEIIKDVGEGFAMGNFEMSSEIVLVKSARALEGKYIDYLTDLCKKQILVTGPLIATPPSALTEELEQERKLIMQWLDEKQDKSVIYLSFGSECFFSKEQSDEMAKGLEICGSNFIWVIRTPPGVVEHELPSGFCERVKGRGLILRKWAPQLSILGHSSVQGFVSHCGWSSITESVFFGVPIIGMPMSVDQPFNARMMVEAGVGAEVVKENGVFKGEEIAKAIGKVVGNEAMKERGKCFRDKMKENEEQEVEEVAEYLIKLCINTNNHAIA